MNESVESLRNDEIRSVGSHVLLIRNFTHTMAHLSYLSLLLLCIVSFFLCPVSSVLCTVYIQLSGWKLFDFNHGLKLSTTNSRIGFE